MAFWGEGGCWIQTRHTWHTQCSAKDVAPACNPTTMTDAFRLRTLSSTPLYYGPAAVNPKPQTSSKTRIKLLNLSLQLQACTSMPAVAKYLACTLPDASLAHDKWGVWVKDIHKFMLTQYEKLAPSSVVPCLGVRGQENFVGDLAGLRGLVFSFRLGCVANWMLLQFYVQRLLMQDES